MGPLKHMELKNGVAGENEVSPKRSSSYSDSDEMQAVQKLEGKNSYQNKLEITFLPTLGVQQCNPCDIKTVPHVGIYTLYHPSPSHENVSSDRFKVFIFNQLMAGKEALTRGRANALSSF